MTKEASLMKARSTEIAGVDDIDEMMARTAGAGLSQLPQDNISPQLVLLQPLSPEVMEGSSRVGDAAAGDFLLGDRLIKGSAGFWFQPVFTEHKLFEFTPLDRGGGFVAEHPAKFDYHHNLVPPEGAEQSGYSMEFDNGNQLIHYRHWHGIGWWAPSTWEPFTIPFKSTGHTTARNWMYKANTSNVLPSGKPRALFAHVYKITSVSFRGAKGTYFKHGVGPAICLDVRVSPDVVKVVESPGRALRMGEDMARSFAGGSIRSAAPDRAETFHQDDLPL